VGATTPRSRRILRWAKSHTPWQAQGTVRNYLSAAMSKLGAPTRHAAAHHAWQQGWI
jgi:DNA-binding CsgD family transcriptional regulator